MTLHVRINDENARIWTTLPEGTTGATELTTDQSKRLRQRITNLAKRDSSFTRHKGALASGKTVKARNNGKVAEAILAVFPESDEQA